MLRPAAEHAAVGEANSAVAICARIAGRLALHGGMGVNRPVSRSFPGQGPDQRAWVKPDCCGNLQEFQDVKSTVSSFVLRYVRRGLA
jgi:hypothetical protein